MRTAVLENGTSKMLAKMETHSNAKIWALAEVDGYIVSGDSNGNVIIWDKRSANALKRGKQIHLRLEDT